MSSSLIEEQRSQNKDPEQTTGMLISDLMHIVKRHFTIFLLTFGIILAGSVVATIIMPKKYTATTELFATYSRSSEVSENMSDINTANLYIQSQIKSYPDLTQTEAVLQPVIDELDLSYDVAELSELITVTNPTGTMLVDIAVESATPVLSQQIADSVARSLSDVVSSRLYSMESSPVKLSIVQRAAKPLEQSSPKILLNIGLGVFLGLVIGISIALLRNLFDKKIRTVFDLKSYSDAPLMGSIPVDEALKGDKPSILTGPNSFISEEFRRIRTNLNFIAPISGTKSRQIVITSAQPSEGKTTTAVNLAVALAENGARVLLIDADLRHPSVAPKLKIDDAVGLAHVLSGQANVADAVQPYWRPNLHILSAGPKPPNAAMLLNSEVMRALVNQALKQYDYVLIDTAPVAVSSDALVFGRKGNGVLLVAGRNVVEKKELHKTVAQFKDFGVSLIGTVMNFAEPQKKKNGNYYYYDTEGERKKVIKKKH